MVDVAIAKIGKELTTLATIVDDGINSKYSKVSTMLEESMTNNLLGRKQTYPYVFYSNSNGGTRVFDVGFTDNNGRVNV